MRTKKQAIEYLLDLYNRKPGFNTPNDFEIRNIFDCYVQDFCRAMNKDEEDVTKEELIDCATNYIENDGGDYLLEE